MLELKIQASILKKIALFIDIMKLNGLNNCSGPELLATDFQCWKMKTELFDCSPTEISLQAIDPSRTSLVHLRLTHHAFMDYRCDRRMSLGIVPRNISNILDFALDENDVVTVDKADDSPSGNITFVLESDTSFCYAMKLRKFEKDDYIDIPKSVQYQATVEMPSARFVRIIESLIGDGCHSGNFRISVTNEGVKFCRVCRSLVCRQENGGRCNLFVEDKAEDGEEATVVEMIMNEAVSEEYDLSYFETFTEVRPVSDKVKINLCAKFPVMVEYKIAKRSWFRFYLAPALEDEDGPTEGGVPGQVV